MIIITATTIITPSHTPALNISPIKLQPERVTSENARRIAKSKERFFIATLLEVIVTPNF